MDAKPKGKISQSVTGLIYNKIHNITLYIYFRYSFLEFIFVRYIISLNMPMPNFKFYAKFHIGIISKKGNQHNNYCPSSIQSA